MRHSSKCAVLASQSGIRTVLSAPQLSKIVWALNSTGTFFLDGVEQVRRRLRAATLLGLGWQPLPVFLARAAHQADGALTDLITRTACNLKFAWTIEMGGSGPVLPCPVLSCPVLSGPVRSGPVRNFYLILFVQVFDRRKIRQSQIQALHVAELFKEQSGHWTACWHVPA